jgi:hypothetical protein
MSRRFRRNAPKWSVWETEKRRGNVMLEREKILLSNAKLIVKNAKEIEKRWGLQCWTGDAEGGRYGWWDICLDTGSYCIPVDNVPDGSYPIKMRCRSLEGTSKRTVKVYGNVIEFKSLFAAVDEVAFNCGWSKDYGAPDHKFIESVTPYRQDSDKGSQVTYLTVDMGS